MFFVLTCVFGFLCVQNSRLSGLSLSGLVAKYCLRYLVASFPMKVGNFSCGMLILHGIGVYGSKISGKCIIFSCFMVCGGSPDCLMIVKNAFSLKVLHSSVILLISSFVMCLCFIFFPLLNLVVSGYD